MIDVLRPQIKRPTAPRGHAWCWGGVALLLISLLPGPVAGQRTGDDAALLTGTIKNPAFCPTNPALVAYSRQVEDTQELYLYSVETGNVRQITAVEETGEGENTDGGFFEPDDDQPLRRFEGQLAWRPLRDPDGRQWFVFMSSASETGYGLFLSYLTPEGELADRTIELPFEGQASAPTWSPDGRQLAFSGSPADAEGNELFLYPNLLRSLRSGEGEVPTNASPVQLTENPAGNLAPAWSPNGQYIAYQSKQAGKSGRANWGISLLDLSTWAGPQSNTRPRSVRLSKQFSAYHEYKPSWSPNGSYVGFYVSQSRVGAGAGNRRQDIGVLQLVRGNRGRVQTGRLLEGFTGQRLAKNVLPNVHRGPGWHPSANTSSLIYVEKEENEGNPIYLADVARWSSDNANYSRRLSTQFEGETRLHEAVDATRGAEGLRLAFASQEGERLRLQLREGLDPTYREAETEISRAEGETERAEVRPEKAEAGTNRSETSPNCRIQFAAKKVNDRLLNDYKERINELVEEVKAKIIKVEEVEVKYKIVSEEKKESEKEVNRMIEKKVKGSKKFDKIKQAKTIPKCYPKGTAEV